MNWRSQNQIWHWPSVQTFHNILQGKVSMQVLPAVLLLSEIGCRTGFEEAEPSINFFINSVSLQSETGRNFDQTWIF